MTDLKRYDMILTTRCGEGWQELQPEPEGEWVRFDDVDALIAERDRLRSALESIHRRFSEADTGSLHIRDGVAWAMDSDARAALALPAPPRGLKP